jgi:hypothetical protein
MRAWPVNLPSLEKGLANEVVCPMPHPLQNDLFSKYASETLAPKRRRGCLVLHTLLA